MLYESVFKNPENTQRILHKLESLSQVTGPVKLMEICGTHTMAIARTGLKTILPKNIQLISGPGCPVCVTPSGVMDEVFKLSEDPRIIITSYGDLLRVPGSVRGDSLLRRKASGANVIDVYSPVDALNLARENPAREVVFLGVGFETTAPGTAACILEACRLGLENFSVLCLLKSTEPALRALIGGDDFSVSGFLCPGHVAAITGSESFAFLPKDYGLPAVVSGFEAADLLYSILKLMQMLADKKPELVNEYVRLVRPEGNPAAKAMMDQVFEPESCQWRGLGMVPDGGLKIRREYARFDGMKRYGITPKTGTDVPGCRCAQVIRGVLSPGQCPLFKTVCTPGDPVGPCMVSSEGSCAAAFRYEA